MTCYGKPDYLLCPLPSFEPTAPRSIEETGLHLLFLADLALKILYNTGSLTGLQMADRLKLPFNGCVDQVMEHLKRELMVEVQGGGGGFGEQGYQYTIAVKGREKAHEALDRSQYAGAGAGAAWCATSRRCTGNRSRVFA